MDGPQGFGSAQEANRNPAGPAGRFGFRFAIVVHAQIRPEGTAGCAAPQISGPVQPRVGTTAETRHGCTAMPHRSMSTVNGTRRPAGPEPARDEQLAFQQLALLGVSRTFALTIPQLPEPLRTVIGNAYLLCRIADTVEDEPHLTADQKAHLLGCFVEVVAGRASATGFAAELHPLLSDATSTAERDLVRHTPAVVSLTRGLRCRQRRAIQRCIRIMAAGTVDFGDTSARTLNSVRDLDRYCYHVAGVVGETITELLCEYSHEIARHGSLLRSQAADFGRALQLVNIIKDLWEDRARGICWLPREAFPRVDLSPHGDWTGPDFEAGVLRLADRARGCLERALEYTLLIPRHETGVRRFLLWTLGMAVLTLRRIHAEPGFRNGDAVKISRRQVRAVVIATSALARWNGALRWLYRVSMRPLVASPPAEGAALACAEKNWG